MLFSISYVTVMAFLVLECSTTSTDSSNEETFHFSISSKKNSSHHRILQVNLMKGIGGNANSSGEIFLDVEHGRSMHNNSELVRLSTTVTVPETPLRRSDYELFPGLGYYKLHTTAQLWETAQEICVREGAHLIVINSEAEANVVKEYFSRKPIFSGSSSSNWIYAGFHDKYTKGDFVTVTGVSLSKSGYTKWESGQPNGDDFGGLNSQTQLVDVPGHYKLGFICEQEL
ncbi:hemolymph lipopolysaccharide-binding protein-like [Anabrus simplex]|uniref:hemolymph lipopolysaccharide-binding protein-like n=1 Tax=Anabrus simplex TaxID=316456 RepID=UPI0035A2995E